MKKETVKKTFKYTILSIILILLIYKLVMYFIDAKSPDIITHGKFEAMLSKSENYNANQPLSNLEQLTKIQEELSEEIINSCSEEDIDFDETQFLKLTIGTNKGYFLYHMHPEDNVIFEAYQPDIIYSVVNSNYSYSYTCPEDIIKKYKETFKKLK